MDLVCGCFRDKPHLEVQWDAGGGVAAGVVPLQLLVQFPHAALLLVRQLCGGVFRQALCPPQCSMVPVVVGVESEQLPAGQVSTWTLLLDAMSRGWTSTAASYFTSQFMQGYCLQTLWAPVQLGCLSLAVQV